MITTLPTETDGSVVMSTTGAATTLNRIADLTETMAECLDDVVKEARRLQLDMEAGQGVRADQVRSVSSPVARFAEAVAGREALIRAVRYLVPDLDTYHVGIALACDADSRTWFTTVA